MIIGAHVSIAKGLYKAAVTAKGIGANTFQFFTRNPRGGKAKELNQDDIEKAHDYMRANSFGKIVAHAPYTYNLASAKVNIREFTIATLKDDVFRIKAMGISYLVLHVGTCGEQGEEKGLSLVIQGLQEVLSLIPDGTEILLEQMAGEGTELGYTFEQLAKIIEGCEYHSQLGICLDSCHMTGAGYDLSNFGLIKKGFDEKIGWERLKAFHLNDSLFPRGARRDRHAKLGEGHIGLATIKNIVTDSDMREIPLILETPNDNVGYAKEITLVKAML
ncbi:MAG: deoxyribonuclease IV [Clostridia bacterium]|nr:deoxyribonuclease IV [Clostridia bacterium]MDD4048008.1 deoxyribonuclease IV [Clostridia bacterium]